MIENPGDAETADPLSALFWESFDVFCFPQSRNHLGFCFSSRVYIPETAAPAPLSLIGTDAAGPLFRSVPVSCDSAGPPRLAVPPPCSVKYGLCPLNAEQELRCFVYGLNRPPEIRD